MTKRKQDPVAALMARARAAADAEVAESRRQRKRVESGRQLRQWDKREAKWTTP